MRKMKKSFALGLFIALGLLVSTIIIYRIDSRSFTSPEAQNTTNHASLYFSEPYIKDSYQHIDIMLDTFENPVSGVDVKIYYTQTAVSVASVAKGISSPFGSYPISKFDSENGTINVAANIGSGSQAEAVKGNNIKVAEIKYSVLSSDDKMPFRFEFEQGKRNDSNVVLMTESSGDTPVDILTNVDNSIQKETTAPVIVSETQEKNSSIIDIIRGFFKEILVR